MEGYFKWGWLPINTKMKLATVHETLHTYWCHTPSNSHVPNGAIGYIMSGALGNWNMHSNTHSTLHSYSNQYDG